MSRDLLLEMKGIVKTFPGVRALRGVDFSVAKGEVHALMGENGAGKSTLIKCLTGIYQKDEGTILFDGREINPRSTQEAQQEGISTIYQELNLSPFQMVYENGGWYIKDLTDTAPDFSADGENLDTVKVTSYSELINDYAVFIYQEDGEYYHAIANQKGIIMY